MSLTIKNCQILKESNLIKTNIYIESNKIKKIGDYVKAEQEIDAESKIILPGIIDPHVHFREPGLTYKEDFFSGSKAAVAGGITTILDMPNTNPATSSFELLEQKRELAKKSIVNYGFHFAATNDNLEEIRRIKNIASIKLFMNLSTGKLMIGNRELLKQIFETSKLLTVHAEGEKVNEAIELIKKTNNRLYLCHITQKTEIDFIKLNKIECKVYVEVTPHHLFLTKKDEIKQKGFAMMKPSLKTKEDQKSLWEGIRYNIVDTIGTDHAPHTRQEKELLQQEKIPSGIPGCETMLPLLLNAINEKRLTLQQLQKLCCENPAKIFKIKNKGYIKEGYDADLTIIDLGLEKEVKNENLYTKCGWSSFNGWKLKGFPIMTIINGNIVFDNGRINNIKAKEIEYY
jgi:dihydroorotase